LFQLHDGMNFLQYKLWFFIIGVYCEAFLQLMESKCKWDGSWDCGVWHELSPFLYLLTLTVSLHKPYKGIYVSIEVEGFF